MASEGERLERAEIRLGGDVAEQDAFLQSLVSNDVSRAAPDRLVYAALLTPQGKFLADFLIRRDVDGNLVLDCEPGGASTLLKRLTMYRLRRPVTLELVDSAPVLAVWGGGAPAGGLADPRHPTLGWRIYGETVEPDAPGDHDLHRLRLGIPVSPTDLTPDTFILEAGFEAMQGVDFRKGCFVGQEIVARMKHKTELRKTYRTVSVTGSAPPGTALETPDGKVAGALYSNRDGIGIALLRHDRIGPGLRAVVGDALVDALHEEGAPA